MHFNFIARWAPYARCIVLLLTLWVVPGTASAQKQYYQWHFGSHVSMQFPGGTIPPTLLTGSQMLSGEGCAAIADNQGQLLFYTNGIQAWNKLHQPLANGTLLGGYAGPSDVTPNSATQGAAIIAKPGSTTEYYIFTVDAAEHNLQTGLTYSLVDMSRLGGLGEVLTKATSLPTPFGDGRVSEKLAIVRHANQRDIWVIVHGWQTNLFYCWLVTPAGVAATPVVSASGGIHQGSGDYPAVKNYNAIGQLKVSPDGKRLALAQFYTWPTELFDFNCGTGIVSNSRKISSLYTYSNYGVEFSPNSNLLYISSVQGLIQYDLLNGQVTNVGSAYTYGALQLGPDGRIYHLRGTDSRTIYVVQQPDQAGPTCAYQTTGLVLQPGSNTFLGLPTVLVTPPVDSAPLVSFGVVGTEICVGELTTFTAASYPVLTGATINWDFGEPSAGSSNTAVGTTVQHRYAKSGTYQATMQLLTTSGQVYHYTQSIAILAQLQTQLQTSGQPCTGQPLTLSVYPAPPAGTKYTWQDGSTGATLKVTASGSYWVDIVPPQACAYRNTLAVQFSPSPVLKLGPDRSIGCEEIVILDATSSIAGSQYRWQDGSTKAQYRATQAGTYTVAASAPTGCTSSATVRLYARDSCLVSVPNIITPNGDHLNDNLVVQGVPAGTCTLRIYNRWGKLVYEQDHYFNDWNASGQALGVYYYLVTTAANRRYKGWVEVAHTSD